MKLNKIIFTTMFSIFLSIPQVSVAQTGVAGATFAAGTLVSGIVDDLKSAASELIDQLDDRISARTFQMRNDLVFLQNELQSSGDQLVGKTFNELSEQQQTFFENASYKIAEVNSLLSSADAEIDMLASQVEQIVAQIPFTGEEPRIRRSNPSYVLSATSDVLITLEGSFLNHGKASLRFDGEDCALKQQIDNKLSFSCGATTLKNTSSEVVHKSGVLTVSGEMSLLERIGGFFGGDIPEKEYQIPINVIPDKLGTYSVTAFVLEDTKQTKPRKGKWGQSNPHCKGKVTKTANFSPTSGWGVDVNSIKTGVSCGRGKEGHAKRNVTSSGFQIESWASNSGRCEKVLGSVVSKDARGCSAGWVKWTDIKLTPKRVPKNIGSGVLSWGSSESVVLPENIQGFIVSLEPLGRPTVKIHSATPSKWIDVKRDAHSTSLILSAATLAKALQ